MVIMENDGLAQHCIVASPRPMYVVWHRDFGLQCIENSDVVKRCFRQRWNCAKRYYEFSFFMGLEHEIVRPSGTCLHLNSVALYQIMLHHSAKVSKNHTFDPERDLKHYFDKIQPSHNLAENWFEHVMPRLFHGTELADIDGSTARYSVGQERELRGPLWEGLFKHPF